MILQKLYKFRDCNFDNIEALHKAIATSQKKAHFLKKLRRDIDDSLHELDYIEESCFERLAELRVNR